MDMGTGRITANFSLVFYYFAASFLTLVFSVFLLIYLSIDHQMISKPADFKLYAALPASNLEATDGITVADGRKVIVEEFFKGHNSPLAPHADTFIAVADQYGLDFRLLPAISMQESIGGKRVINNSHNPFGFGIYGSKAVYFETWDEAIEVVGKSLREDYLNQGLTNPFTIMTKYTPSSESKGSPWAKGVTHFMEELK
jgi:hypothetical protein